MKIFRYSSHLEEHLSLEKTGEKSIGFVPTMGALHGGHLSLISIAKKENDIVVASIFVNPTQFNNPEDLKKYPVQKEKDIVLLYRQGCDILFLPEETEIYPDESSRHKTYDLGYLDTLLEASHRPGHFQGVCMVLESLLYMIMPDQLYIGQKDYQQCMVISRLVNLLDMKTKINISPTLRDPSGLAMSSRNKRLSTEQKEIAPLLYASLRQIKNNMENSTFAALKKAETARLVSNGFEIEYIALTDENLQSLQDFVPGKNTVLLIAASLGKIRLIDNLLL